jgi:hypothetical protein
LKTLAGIGEKISQQLQQKIECTRKNATINKFRNSKIMSKIFEEQEKKKNEEEIKKLD